MLKTKFVLILLGSLAACVGFVFWMGPAQGEASPPHPLKVGFFIQHFTVRGTEVAIYDYADLNEALLGNVSVIFCAGPHFPCGDPVNSQDSSPVVRALFEKRFGARFLECSSLEERDQILLREKIDVLYLQKTCQNDGKLSKSVPNAVHAVFPPLRPYGEMYASISEWLSRRSKKHVAPYVPHVVRLDATKETLHSELEIPRDAVIFGRHGGADSFDIPFVKEAVISEAHSHSNWYFLFLNTEKFCDLPNVIFLPPTPDLVYKTKFINTCDAMIHARLRGETFGLACAEFSIQNKPVLTWSGNTNPKYERAHLDILTDKGLYYNNQDELISLLEVIGGHPEQFRAGGWDAYSEKYSPEPVMRQFDKVFLCPIKEKQRKDSARSEWFPR